MNGDDRWPDVLLATASCPGYLPHRGGRCRHRRQSGDWPGQLLAVAADPGGPSALDRLDRDVLSLSGVTSVIWSEGINDFSKNGNASADAVIAGMKQGVARIRDRFPGARVIGRRSPRRWAAPVPRTATPNRTASARPSTSSSAPGDCLMASPTSTGPRLIPLPARCGPSSFPRAPRAGQGRSCTPTAPDTKQWRRRSISRPFSPAHYRRDSV